jgi:sialate O-acetylesterase
MYQAATAKIEGDTVALSSQMVKDPIHVRYGWAPNPDCNLYNGDGLPASPFEARVKLVR